jgi:hypothetical protein
MSKNQNFEEAWKNAFENAEVTPSPKLWKGIEKQLPNQSLWGRVISLGSQYYVAAAVAASVSMISLGTYFALKPNTSTNQEISNIIQKPTDNQTSTSETNQISNENTSTTINEQSTKNSNSIIGENTQKELANSSDNQNIDSKNSTSISSKNQSNLITKNTKKKVNSNKESVLTKNTPSKAGVLKDESTNEKDVLLADNENNKTNEEIVLLKSEVFERANGKSLVEKPIENQLVLAAIPQTVVPTARLGKRGWNFFGSVSIGSVAFEPNFKDRKDYNNVLSNLVRRPADTISGFDSFNQGENVVSFLRSVRNSQELSPKINSSYSYGVNLGAYFHDRLNIQVGVYRKHFTATSYSYAIVWDLQNIEIIHLDFANYDKLEKYQFKMESVKPYKITHEYDFVSIPVLLGYKVIDRKIDLEANLGLSTEIFLRNKVYTTEVPADVIRHDRFDTKKVFQDEHIQAVFGCNVSYNFLKNCSLNVSPSYQKAITDFTVSSSSFSSRPSQFGLSFGIRYDLN